MIKYDKYKPSGVEWIGEIPEHWDVKKLKYVCSFEYGNSLPSNERTDGNIPVYGSNGIVGYHDVATTDSPCIIVGRKGSYGKINISDVKCFPIDTTYYIDNTKTKENVHWLFYLLGTLDLDGFSEDTGVPGLSREYAYNRDVITPSQKEQEAIAVYLDEKCGAIDAVIERKERLLALYAEKRQAIINRAVTCGIDPSAPMRDSGIPWLGSIPAHWEVKKLKYIASLKSGESITSEYIKEDGMYPVYGGNGFRGYYDRFTHDGHYVLIGRQGALCGNINYASGKFWASEHAILCTLKDGFSTKWFGELLKIMNLNQYSVSAAQPGLSVENIRVLFIPMPPTEEQTSIVSYIEAKCGTIDKITEKLRKQIELYKEYRTALIANAVTGKIKVTE